ncbi:hypothetical protein C8R46DRAFT_982058 [Mycena filopes]|nr:hypothetical protein C8R46DRAFT_982058 [Mycena filopes]
MSTTRRQSGRLAQQAIAPAADTAATPTKKPAARAPKSSGTEYQDDDEMFEESEDESDAESDASEYGQRPLKRQKTTKTPTATVKKSPATAKKSTAKTATKSRKGKGTGDATCHLTEIPLDVLLEIFSHLEPKDIIQLSRTNHTFRSHLLSSASKSVWRNARENVDGPDCHEDMSEQQWAHLLYGPAQCQSCGAKGVQRVDFGLRRRACTRCLKANLVVTSSFKKRYPHLEKSLLNLIPYTHIGGSAHGHASRSNFYWNEDIEEMAETVARYDRDIHMRIAGAQKALDDFIAQRVALVKAVVDHADVCTDWSIHLALRRQEETTSKIAARYDAIEARFRELDYTDDDISVIQHSNEASQRAALTDSIWKRIRPILEPRVQAAKEERLKTERDARIRARTALVEEVYKNYRQTLVPRSWRYLPSLYEIRQSSPFSAVIDLPNAVDVRIADFKDAEAALPTILPLITAARKAELLRLIEAARTAEPNLFTAASQDSDPRTLTLATSVFKCARSGCSSARPGAWRSEHSRVLIGWDAAINHRCRVAQWNIGSQHSASVATVLKFSKRGCTAAASLVVLAGSSEQQMTAAQMDELDLRFICMACPPQMIKKSTDTHPAYSWRAAVIHFEEGHHSTPLWRQLTDAEAQQVKTTEGADPTLSWCCNHCPHNLDDCNTHSNVVNHVKTAHKIPNPSDPGDLFRYLDLPLTPATISYPRAPKVKIKAPKPNIPAKPVVPGGQYSCLHCSSSKHRVFILGGVKMHLKDKHQVPDPVANRDWKQVGA